MTARWQIEPMPHWPYPETKHRSSTPFSAPWSETLILLDRELTALDVTGAVAVRVVGQPTDIRRDGMLRANARIHHPGVCISFQSRRHGDLAYPCDTFTAHDGSSWQANVRAIALALEALRKVARYGVGARGEQYAGWRQIEARTEGEFASADEASRFLYQVSDCPGSLRDAARTARAMAHPDRRDGDRTLWDRVEAARARLIADGHLEAS